MEKERKYEKRILATVLALFLVVFTGGCQTKRSACDAVSGGSTRFTSIH